MKFTLTHLTGSRAGSVQELSGHALTIGRDPSNALAFDPVADADVSGFHANLTVQGAQVLLSDLGSSNGTLVNGQRIQGSVPLISGCTIQFGEKGPIVSVQFAPLVATSGAEGAAAAGGRGGAPAGGNGAGVATAGTSGGASPATAAPTARGPGVPPGQPPPALAGAAPALAPGPPGAPDAAAAPPAQPKPPSALALRLKGCGFKVVGTVILTIVIGAVCYVFRGQLQQVVPSGAQRYLRKIPGVSLIFSKAKSPTQALPPAARDAKRLLPRGSKSKPAKTSEDKSSE